MSTYDTSPRFLGRAMKAAVMRAIRSTMGQRARKMHAARALAALRRQPWDDNAAHDLVGCTGAARLAVDAGIKAWWYVRFEVDMASDGRGNRYPKQIRAAALAAASRP